MKIIPTMLLVASLLGGHAEAQETNPMLNYGQLFMGTTYVAHTLDTEEGEEALVINCDQVDCTTFVEYVLALALCAEQEQAATSQAATATSRAATATSRAATATSRAALDSCFAANVQRIRYRDGQIKGYSSRLHYFSDWINNGIKGGFLEDVTATNSPDTLKLNLSYMTTHPTQYRQLAKSEAEVARMAHYEKALSGQLVHWIPKEKLPATGYPWIKGGDIIAITTRTPGLDIVHVGLASYVDGKLCLLHASSSLGKVVVSSLPLSQMMHKNSSWTGIRVIRRCFPVLPGASRTGRFPCGMRGGESKWVNLFSAVPSTPAPVAT